MHMKKNRKLKMIEQEIREAEEIEYDKNGSAVITVGLQSKEDFFDPYCFKTYKTLNTEMLEFIEKSAENIPSNKDISLHIHTEIPTSSEEKKQMKDAINNQFAKEYVSARKLLKKNIIEALIFAIIGLGVLALALLLENLDFSSILANTVMIIAWVFEGGAAELLIFDRPPIMRKSKIMKKLLNCRVYIQEN